MATIFFNSQIQNAYLRKLGVPENWNIVDVLGLDEELLAMVPQPVLAVILLFPCSEKVSRLCFCQLSKLLKNTFLTTSQYESHRLAEDEKIKENIPSFPDDLFYLKQTIHNACGTCALIHAVSNSKE